MTMMNGLDSIDLEILDEAFFGPPPRFLVDGYTGIHEMEMPSERAEGLGVFSGLAKIKQLMSAWN